MKKYLSLLLALVLVLSLTACGKIGPDEQLSAEIDAVIEFDPEAEEVSEAVEELIDELDVEDMDEAKAVELVQALVANLSYTIDNVVDNGDGTAVVTLTATNVDMGKLMPVYTTAVMDKGIELSITAEEMPSDAEIATMTIDMLIAHLQDSQFGTMSLTEDIAMTWDDEEELWTIDDEDLLADTVYGGMISWVEDDSNLEAIRPTPSLMLEVLFSSITDDEARLDMAKSCVGKIVGDTESGAIEPQMFLDIADGLFGRFDYEMGQMTYTPGEDTAVVRATVTNANIGKAMDNFMNALMSYASSGLAATGEQLNIEILNLLRDAVLDDSLDLVTTDLEMSMTWDGQQWVMDDFDSYMDACTGGMLTWAQSLM